VFASAPGWSRTTFGCLENGYAVLPRPPRLHSFSVRGITQPGWSSSCDRREPRIETSLDSGWSRYTLRALDQPGDLACVISFRQRTQQVRTQCGRYDLAACSISVRNVPGSVECDSTDNNYGVDVYSRMRRWLILCGLYQRPIAPIRTTPGWCGFYLYERPSPCKTCVFRGIFNH
jgi:hypothetical protein